MEGFYILAWGIAHMLAIDVKPFWAVGIRCLGEAACFPGQAAS